MRRLHCAETSGNDYLVMRRHIAEEQKLQLRSCERKKNTQNWLGLRKLTLLWMKALRPENLLSTWCVWVQNTSCTHCPIFHLTWNICEVFHKNKLIRLCSTIYLLKENKFRLVTLFILHSQDYTIFIRLGYLHGAQGFLKELITIRLVTKFPHPFTAIWNFVIVVKRTYYELDQSISPSRFFFVQSLI